MSGPIAVAKRRDLDMTQGNILKLLITFALPLFAGNVFQQFYNVVDTWTVGNYVSDEAFSAVGTVTPVINTFISIFSGFSAGSGVVISQYYGAKNYEKVHDAVHTAIALTLILAVLLTAVGILLVPNMLHLTKTPEEVFPESRAYLTIYFAGVVGLLMYNMGAGILRAVGDSRRPFYYLVSTAVVNIVLDLLLVIRFHMGVRGVAYATIIAQGTSALLVIGTLMRSENCVKLCWRDLKIHSDMLKKVIRTGLPAALQMGITSFSNVFVQSYINQFGEYCMGGWTAYHKIDQLIVLPMQSIAMAVSTFVGQNLGCGQSARAKRGVTIGVLMSMAFTGTLSALVAIFAPQLVRVFIATPETVAYGTMFLHWITPFYSICCINQVLTQALRGAGNSKTPMVFFLSSYVVFRQIYLYIVSHYISNTILPLAMGYPAGWILGSILILWYYKTHDISRTALVSASERRCAEVGSGAQTDRRASEGADLCQKAH